MSSKIIEAARAYIDTPWVHQGRKLGVGIDCVGLLICTGWDIGLPIEDYRTYHRNVDGKLFEEILSKYCIKLHIDELVVDGDIMGFSSGRRDKLHHAGFKSPVGIIHAVRENAPGNRKNRDGEVREEMITSTLFHRFHSAWRYKALWQP